MAIKNKQVHSDALTKVAKINASGMGGLPVSICLSIGKPYMITANINVSDGLVNENMGTLLYIKRDEHGNLVRLWVEFPTSTVGIVVPARTMHITTAHPYIEFQCLPVVMRTTTTTIYARKILRVRGCSFPLRKQTG